MTYSINKPDVVWRAEEYHELAIAQNSAPNELMERLIIADQDHILDVGCGNGRITATLSKKVASGKVLGIDKSKEMIRFAAETFPTESYPNLQFKIQEAQHLSFVNEFNIVFSSFALQWVEDKGDFFKKTHKCLKENGFLATIIPLGISPELEKSIDLVITSPKWCGYYREFHPNWFFSDGTTIRQAIEESGFNVNYISSCIQEASFTSRTAFEKYILLWFPYLHPLPESLKDIFFNQVLEEYFKILPIQANGSVLLRIPRLDLIAQKINF